MTNINCLEGFECPKCKADGPFKITIQHVVFMHDDGTDIDQDSDCSAEFGNYDPCECPKCGHHCTVIDFKPAERGNVTVPRGVCSPQPIPVDTGRKNCEFVFCQVPEKSELPAIARHCVAINIHCKGQELQDIIQSPDLSSRGHTHVLPVSTLLGGTSAPPLCAPRRDLRHEPSSLTTMPASDRQCTYSSASSDSQDD